MSDCKDKPCGCEDTPLTTPAPCNPVGCPDPYPCTETTDAECVIYSGPDIICTPDVVVPSNTNVSDALNDIVDYFCAKTPDPADVVIVEGDNTSINVTSVTISNTTTYTVTTLDTGWVNLEGFAYYQGSMASNKPQVRRMGKQIHFRGDLYIPLSSGSAAISLIAEDTYRTVQRQNPWIGVGGMYNDGTDRLLFNSNGSAAQSVIPTSVLPALTNLDGTYKLSQFIATRQIEILSSLTLGQSGTATLTAPVTIEILSNKTLRVTALQQLEENPADFVSFDGNSSLRNITSKYQTRDPIINLSEWLYNNGGRSGLNSGWNSLQTTGLFQTGTTYVILDYNAGDDFTNIGGVNIRGNIFTATGPAPTVWTNLSQVYQLFQAISIPENYFLTGLAGTAQWAILLDGITLNAAEHTSLGGFKISLDGLIAYLT
jgi:hypothetical protein